jgi:pimeloyl-ACP methyl ester carboxylesterase
MGYSTRKPGRTLLDWADDIRDFAAQKSIVRFAVVGVSQGGPYATVCAYALHDLLSSATLISGVSPLDDPDVYASQTRMLKFFIFLGRNVPGLLALQFALMKPMMRNPERLFRSLLGNLPPVDQQAMPAAIPILAEDIRESLRQGGGGAADDMHACVTEWGFRLEDIKTPVFLWQGESDPNVTPEMGRYMAAKIPNCQATFVPNAGHFLFLSCWENVLQQLRGGK